MFEMKINNYNASDDANCLPPKLTGGGCCAQKVYHEMVIIQTITITDENGEHDFYIEYQNGNPFPHSMRCLSNDLEIYIDGTHKEICIIVGDYNVNDDDDMQYILDELSEYGSIIDTKYKVKQVYNAIVENEPYFDDFLTDGHSDNVDDYFIDEDGNLTLID